MSLKHVEGRIVAKVDREQKQGFTLSDGTEIALIRDVDNFDRRYTEQVLGVVVDAENIPKDALVLFHHNSLHETYEIRNHSQLSGKEIASGIKYFSIMERDVFFWKMREEQEWRPTENFQTALRVFKPYEGFIQGIPPKQITDTLYVTSGDLQGKVVRTLKASDYLITFRDPTTGRDVQIIRFRPHGDEKEKREPEAIAIMNNLTEQLNNGELLVGLTTKDAKPILQYA
jgi:hypothetical protein